MAGKKTGKRMLTWVLVLVMALSLLPLNVLAANGPGMDSGSGMIFTKKLVSDMPDKDGNYTIQMTAQATGTTTTTTTVKPMDIVLVLDVSGSMGDPIPTRFEKIDAKDVTKDKTYYVYAKHSTPLGLISWHSYDKVKWCDRCNSFTHICFDFIGHNKGHKYDPTKDQFYTKIDEIDKIDALKTAVNGFIDQVAKNSADSSIAVVSFASEAANVSGGLRPVKTDAETLKAAVNKLSANGATRADSGMQEAANILNSSTNEDSKKVVVMFTDGEPTSGNKFEKGVANATILAAKSMKDNGTKVFTVGVFDSDPDERTYDYMNYVSSNYPQAQSMSNPGDSSDKDYYTTADSADSLSKVFKDISETITKPEPVNDKLDEKTVITDTLSDYFTFALTEDGKVDVKVSAIDANGNKRDSADAAKVKPVVTGNTVTVKGYDFSAHYQGIGGNAEETLVIEIKVKPSGDGCTSKEIPTNKGNATVTLDNKEIAQKEPPFVKGYSVEYVIDDDDDASWPNNEAPEKLYYPKDVTITVTDKVPTREGFEFTGWKSDIEDDDKVYTYNGINSFTMPAANVVLTPKWTENTAPILSVEKTVTSIGGKTPVTDDTTGKITTVAYPGDEIVWTITVTNSGNAAGNFTLRDVLKGRTDELTVSPAMAEGANSYTIAPKNPTTGKPTTMTFTVTYTVQPADVTGNGLVNTVTMNGTSVESALVPTAQKYTVTYKYTGTIPTGASAVPAAAQHEFGAEVTIENVPTLTGYTFHGWTLPEGLTANDGKFNMPAKNVTITGYWTKNTIPTYTFDLNDPDTITVYKNFVSKYGRSAEKSFTATATIEKETYTAEVDPNSPSNRSAATAEPTYIGEAIGTVTLKTDTTKAFDFGKDSNGKDSNGKDSKFQLEPGDYRITVEETKGTDRYVNYDTEPYTHTYEFTVDNKGQISIKTPITFTITNEYTKRHSAATPSKPTLNTGDHYAYVMGYPDGTVRPNGSITRAEVSAILFRLLSDKTRDEYFTTESSFTDVKAGAWYNNSIATLEKAGVIVDTAKGDAFRPNEAITRAELAAMLAQFSDAKPVKGVKFSDVSAEHWAYEAIAIAAKMGWIEGYPDGTFRPDATITRAEMMTLVNRALERVPSDEDHLLSKRVMLTFPDCKSGDWFYIAVQEATNSHTYERAATEKNGDEQWTALRANRDWTLLEK